MITKLDLEARVREWGLREEVVEKDYVLGWVLWGIGAHPLLSARWAFKGGTCLKKCYVETYRFSEDLDFTVLPHGPIREQDLRPILEEILNRITDESGVDFSRQPPVLKTHSSGNYTEGRIYYQGPRGAHKVARIKLDLSGSEQVVRPTVLRPVSHPFPDKLPDPGTVRCYGFEEVFAEKIRAMGERGRPRDLYDIVNLYRRPDLRSERDLVYAVLIEKCRTKGVDVPSYRSIVAAGAHADLESEWENMLAHQLPALPPFRDFWSELEALFMWLEGTIEPEALPVIPMGEAEESFEVWSPPPTSWVWGQGIPLETVRFAASNHLCIRLGYNGTHRIVEPYSLRRTRDGNLILHAIRVDSREHRSYRVDRIQSVEATTHPFNPVYQVEFSGRGSVYASPTATYSGSFGVTGIHRARAKPSRLGLVYLLECPHCGKRFRRTTRSTRLRPHKNESGYPCFGRTGFIVDTRHE